MQHEQHPEGGEQQPDINAEHEAGFEPRIYVVERSSSQRGIQHGLWIDANQAPADLDADIAAMLASSPTVDATEWGVEDSDDFAGLDLSSTTDTVLIAQLARGVAAHGVAFASWATLVENDREQLDRFDDAYIDSYATPEAWARSLADRLGWHEALDQAVIDPLLRPYVVLDYTAIAEDSYQHWRLTIGADGMVHVFVK